MRYIANHYVSANGAFYTRGEVFEAEFTAEEEERMLRLGAIRKADAPFSSPENTDEEDQNGGDGDGLSPVSEPMEAQEETPGGEDMEPAEETLTIDPLEAVRPAKETKKGRKKE